MPAHADLCRFHHVLIADRTTIGLMRFVVPSLLAASVLGFTTTLELERGTTDDAVLLLQGRVLLPQPNHAKGLKFALRCANRNSSTTTGALYLVDKQGAQLPGKGIGYYFSKRSQDRDIRTLAHWGTVVRGVDHGDGWLEVGECFLPMQLEEKPVLKLIERPADPHVKAAPTRSATSGSSTPSAAAAGFVAGDAVEMYSGKTRKWYPCVVSGRGVLPDTYNVHVPGAPKDKVDRPNVPARALRRAPGTAESARAPQGVEESLQKLHSAYMDIKDLLNTEAT